MESTPPLLHECFEAQVRRDASATALDIPPGQGRPQRHRVSYGALWSRSTAIGAALDVSAGTDALVALLLPRTEVDLFAAELAVLRRGAAWLALDPALPDAPLQHMLADARPAHVLTTRAQAARAASLEVDAATLMFTDEIADAPGAATLPDVPVAADDLAYVIYTSGTTGRPKGVLLEHLGIATLIEGDRSALGLGPGDRVAQGSSHGYDSSVEETWMAFSVGATLVVLDDETIRAGPDLVPWLQAERITAFCPPPTLLRMLGGESPQEALPDIRVLYVGGEALPADLARTWAPGRLMVNGYGPTECSVTVTRDVVTPEGPVTIGRAVPGSAAHVLDEDLADVPVGTAGELCISGASLARGYLHAEALTAERFPVHPVHGRLYRTGDLARRLEDGRLEHLGRLDSQVKVRGHRVELEAVEAVLAGLRGVAAAGVRLVGTGATARLVAWLVAREGETLPGPGELQRELGEAVAPHMIPARVHPIARLPTLPSGKLDRRALVEPQAADPEPAAANRGRAPSGALEGLIGDAMSEVLALSGIDPDADFFLDLGGDSVAAARLVSRLRLDPRTTHVAVRDLYRVRSAAGLAALAGSRSSAVGVPPPDSRARDETGPGRPRLMTLAQAAVLLLEAVVAAGLVYAIWFGVLEPLVAALGVAGALFVLPLVGFLLALVWIPIGVTLLVAVKRVLVPRYVAGRIPAWTAAHFRHWLLLRFSAWVPWSLLAETVFLNGVLRRLGARIGERVHIHRGVDLARGGWDLLEIGDDASIGRDAALRVLELVDGHLVFGAVRIGDRAVVETRAGVDGGAVVGEEACLGALSWLPAGSTLAAGQRAEGIPAEVVPALPRADEEGRASVPAPWSPVRHAWLTLLARFALGFALYVDAFALPSLLALALWPGGGPAVEEMLFGAGPTAAFAGAFAALLVLALVLGTVLSACAVRLLGRVPTGTCSRWSGTWLLLALKRDVVAASGALLSGSLFWPLWLRLAGMRIGQGSEISSISDAVPDLVEIGEESFLADGIYLGGPEVRAGRVDVEAIRLGARTFLGNHVVVPAGTKLPDDVLVGVATVADGSRMPARSAWFGHPAFSLPRREVVEADRRLTHDPGPVRFANRVFWESLRFLLPVPPLLVFLAWLLGVVTWVEPTALGLLVHLPLLSVAAAAALALLVVLLKWFLLGRVRPGQHVLWSCWCSRWDFLYVAWGAWARPVVARFEGSLLLTPWLRAMGVRVGKRTLLGAGFSQVVDPDMISIGDRATASPNFQAHSFEDRVLKIDRVEIRADASVRSDAILFYGAVIGEKTQLHPQAVVMKHEHLSPGLSYAGAPAEVRA